MHQPESQLAGGNNRRRVASSVVTRTTLSDGSTNVVVEENGNRRETWNVPPDTSRVPGGRHWCEYDLQYTECTDPNFDQNKCDNVQTRLCRFCTHETNEFNQAKCNNWLDNRVACIASCDDQLVETRLDDFYTSRESL